MADVRRLTPDDIDGAAAVQMSAFDDYDRRFGVPVPPTTPERVEWLRGRIRHFLRHDPEGSLVAEIDSRVVGVALALKREGLWGLSLLAVDPSTQSRGLGRRLLAAALAYADADRPAVILSSRDPRAIHRYASAGFDLHPQVRATGVVARERVRRPELPVRDGASADVDMADALDRELRGAARGPDHEQLSAGGPMFVVDSGRHRGYAYLRGGEVRALSASDEAAASALLWRCLAHAAETGDEATVAHVAANQQWAVRAAVEAGLSIAPSGPVFWRNGSPPAACLPCGPYL